MRVLRVLTVGLIVLALVLGGCGPQTPGGAGTKTIVIGFTASQTGSLSAESKEQVQGLQLWVDEVNAKGGFKAGNTTIRIELKSYDDGSSSDQVPDLYRKLATEDKVDYLLSPYSSGLAAAAAAVAEQSGKVMIAAGAASDTIFDKGYQQVFQVYTPASRYLTGAVDMLKAVDPTASRIAIIYEKEKFATDVATFAKEYASQQGLAVVLFEGYDTGTANFTAIISRIVSSNPDAILGGGHAADGNALARQLYEKNIRTKLISLLVAPAMPEFAGIGAGANYVTGPSQWEPQAQYSQEGAKALGIPFVGPAVADFTQAYKAKYGYEPGYHASGGYASGLILQWAMEKAGSVDPAQVKAALEKADLLTCYGRIKFAVGDRHGLQIGHEMVYLQWQKDGAGQLVKQVVWPEAGRSAPLLYPRQVR